MPQFERRLYEPSDDMRAFDAGEDDLEEEGSRLPLLIVIALVVLASFAGVVWLAYTQGVQRGRESAPRIIAAQPNEKISSAEKNPYAGLNIYKPSKPNDAQVDQGTLPRTPSSVAPKPGTSSSALKVVAPSIKPAAIPTVPATKSAAAKPLVVAQNKTASASVAAQTAKPVVTAAKPVASPIVSKGSPTKPTIVPQRMPAAKQTGTRSAPLVVPSQAPTRAATAVPRIVAPHATLKPAPKPPVPPAKSATAESVPNKTTIIPAAPTTAAPKEVSLNPPSAEKATTAAAEQTTEDHAGGFLLQIGSYKSEAEANASWQTYKSAHPVVAAYASDIHRAELGAKGTWYRLRVGPFASLTEANAACAKIKASGGNCFPAKR